MKLASSEHVVYTNCSLFWHSEQFNVHDMFWACNVHVLNFCNSMNNLLSYCGLVDASISASEKDLPVSTAIYSLKVKATLGPDCVIF